MRVQCVNVCVLVLLAVCSALICPDGGMCEDGDTCCQTTSGNYGCCPLPNAECCSDHLHCCFQGTRCDLAHSKCVNKTVSLPLIKRRPARPPTPTLLWEDVGAVVCPDKESECPEGTTCCQLPKGTWGCCPMANAVCCEDKMHCCPEKTKCDLEHSKCVSATLGSTAMWRKFRARKRQHSPEGSLRSITCPGAKSACPDRTTCCLMKSGGYGCCPYPSAVCCSDQLHCCPNNTTCDLEHKMCASSHTQKHTPLAPKLPALLLNRRPAKEVICPDKLTTCPDGTTCCALNTRSYGCCPMPKAVCCSDQMHCCPEGTSCDLKNSTCVSANGCVSWSTKIPALNQPQTRAAAVPCNDTVACPDGSTCCKTASGAWACCPLEEAVCCPDHLHCCPHATVCNLRASTCDDPADPLNSVPWAEKTPALPLERQSSNEKCDESTSCPGKYTCCKTGAGGWGCCPLPEAVCCEDMQHCCPHGSTCNLAASTCDSANGPVPLVRKVPALSASPRTGAGANADDDAAATLQAPVPSHGLMCDGHTSCPDDNTCCYMHNAGKWGCCPLRQAVCCSTGDHCCPRGFTCDEKHTSCTKGRLEIPWYRKQEARATQVSDRSEVTEDVTDVKCDNESTCASGSTCCKLPTGEWGCCPLVKAVCCADQEHCCPQGYTCKLESGTCVKPLDRAAPVPLSPLSESLQPSQDVQCDAATRCNTDQTCCRTSPNSWACCPYKRAVCCPDMMNCCPMGYTCDPEIQGCTKGSHLTWWDSVFTEGSRH
ncbi:granulin b isoform X2 [Clupea harengus]|uniref:Granulin b isoform X2 n=1 Tax=Clupea harengus TaxID=7950 RepID=A0A6P3VZS7_CLUHA|nr:granulin b isoform X2 [Clupea harengus]